MLYWRDSKREIVPVIMRQTRFELSPDRLIMVQATIHALDDNKHVTIPIPSTIFLVLHHRHLRFDNEFLCRIAPTRNYSLPL